MITLKSFAALLLLSAGTAHAQPIPPLPTAEFLMTKALADYPGKEALVLAVTFPPGGADPVHRHDAHAFVYVLEGSIVMGVRGEKPVTLNVGETFYEDPNHVHTIGRNASLTKSAKFLVVLLKDRGKPVAMPAR